ncbi:hypothetical protein FGO68_gene3431 [Halteria grandinella]|uniref:Uncharacterized protein n=1 Tax=Halteria grandinella TaxID=5974 RepID=A0A8J8N8C6_HALGN|nr:hypothetical protein FGO68_gene3431 [Halteria grandinella]
MLKVSFVFFQFQLFMARGQRERRPPHLKIAYPSNPHLGLSQGSARPECNGRASTWGNRLADHGIPCTRQV